MTLFTLLLVLAWERLFKLGDHWQLDHRIEVVFNRLIRVSLLQTLLLTAFWMAAVWVCLWVVDELFFGVINLLLWILVCLLCIGAGKSRQHYRAYLKAARQGDAAAVDHMSEELALIYGLPADNSESTRLRNLQNALLWINFRYYLAPLFWFVAFGTVGPVALAGYAFLRAYQRWLAQASSPVQRAQSGIDHILHWIDWVPVRFVGAVYALFGRGEKALPAWVASLGDFHSPQYQVLTQLAQLSLACESDLDPVQMPRAAVSLARRVTWMIVVVVALLTIFGGLM